MFYQRQGWSASEDTLPARFLTAAPAAGCAERPVPAAGRTDRPAPAAGRTDHPARGDGQPTSDPGQFHIAKLRYYERRGWNTDGTLPADGEAISDHRLT